MKTLGNLSNKIKRAIPLVVLAFCLKGGGDFGEKNKLISKETKAKIENITNSTEKFEKYVESYRDTLQSRFELTDKEIDYVCAATLKILELETNLRKDNDFWYYLKRFSPEFLTETAKLSEGLTQIKLEQSIRKELIREFKIERTDLYNEEIASLATMIVNILNLKSLKKQKIIEKNPDETYNLLLLTFNYGMWKVLKYYKNGELEAVLNSNFYGSTKN